MSGHGPPPTKSEPWVEEISHSAFKFYYFLLHLHEFQETARVKALRSSYLEQEMKNKYPSD